MGRVLKRCAGALALLAAVAGAVWGAWYLEFRLLPGGAAPASAQGGAGAYRQAAPGPSPCRPSRGENRPRGGQAPPAAGAEAAQAAED